VTRPIPQEPCSGGERGRAHLRELRLFEARQALPLLPRGGRLLEIGAGSGWQAELFAKEGLCVTAVDVPGAEARAASPFPVLRYDGRSLPFRGQAFDAVFSSHVLEHVRDFPALQRELRRVLRPGGVMLHVLPTPTWRAWSALTYYVRLARETWGLARDAVRQRSLPAPGTQVRPERRPASWWGWSSYLVPRRHGERGSWLSEVRLFSRRRWVREFASAGLAVRGSFPAGVFYTGESVLGGRLPLPARRRLARVLGSASRVYVLGIGGEEAAPPCAPAEDGSNPGTRFPFGRNWRRYLRLLDEDRVRAAERSLEAMLGTGRLRGATFLDVGCGSGLLSLAALRLGATRVHSFDFDAESVEAAGEVKRRFAPEAGAWHVERGDVLDEAYLQALGRFDVVYAWGVLHHTGRMWLALERVASLVGPEGRLFVSIYNDQGWRSRLWRAIKRGYNRSRLARWAIVGLVPPAFELRWALGALRRGRSPLQRHRSYADLSRGMSSWHDWLDWLGGYPFEVARPEEVVRFCEARGFEVEETSRVDGWGCNQFVFRRAAR
jgi:2-polyprenyl-6-hydroxyphenyl methylase/3-demethylubiquinone-9 3-methyltransferase